MHVRYPFFLGRIRRFVRRPPGRRAYFWETTQGFENRGCGLPGLGRWRGARRGARDDERLAGIEEMLGMRDTFTFRASREARGRVFWERLSSVWNWYGRGSEIC